MSHAVNAIDDSEHQGNIQKRVYQRPRPLLHLHGLLQIDCWGQVAFAESDLPTGNSDQKGERWSRRTEAYVVSRVLPVHTIGRDTRSD